MTNPMPQTLPAPNQPGLHAARQPQRLKFPKHRRREHPAAVIFSPLAWLKLMLFLHAGDTEVGGFGISAEKQPLYVEDFQTVKQVCTCVTVAFDDTAVADYFDDCIDKGLTPARFARIWAHTHPGESPQPSTVDEETFQRVFGECDWAIMLIVSRTHETYARLSFNAGPGGSLSLPVQVDWEAWPQALIDKGAELSAMFEKWMDEYGTNVHEAPIATHFSSEFDFTPSRESRTSHLFREDDIYARHDQLGLDDEFASYFETAGREER
jgi:hypothetical protein